MLFVCELRIARRSWIWRSLRQSFLVLKQSFRSTERIMRAFLSSLCMKLTAGVCRRRLRRDCLQEHLPQGDQEGDRVHARCLFAKRRRGEMNRDQLLDVSCRFNRCEMCFAGEVPRAAGRRLSSSVACRRGWQKTEYKGSVSTSHWQETESEGRKSAGFKVLHGRHCLACLRSVEGTELEHCSEFKSCVSAWER